MTLWRRHDGYVLRAFLGAFGAVLVFFTLIVVVVDLAERVRFLTRNWERLEEAGHAPLGMLLSFYGTLIPFLWLRILPFAAPMAAAFALARLARHQELVPLVTAGVSMRRVVLPILVVGALLAAGMVVARATIVPELNREHQRLSRTLTKRLPDRIVNVPHVHDAEGGRLSAGAFQPLGRRLEDAWITFPGAAERPAEIQRYPELAWDAERGAWFAPQGGLRIPLDGEHGGRYRLPIEPGARAPLASGFELLEILCDADNSLGTSFKQSAALVRAHPDNPAVVVRHHQQITLPLSTLILLGLTLPACVAFGRHNALDGMLTALGLGALYFGASQLLADLAGTGSINPVVLAWLPTVVFGSLAASMLAGMRS
jgi:lipopolysaccharide export system permease protein